MNSRLCITIAAVLCLLRSVVRAASIGVRFTNGVYSLAATDLAGVPGFAQTHFNNVQFSGSSLFDNSGAATTLSFTTGGFSIGGANSVSGPDETLNQSDLNGPQPGLAINLSGIPYSSYSILVYELPATGFVTQSTTIGSTTYYSASPLWYSAGYVDGNPATPFNYLQGISTNSASPTANADYELFSGLSGATQSLTVACLTSGNAAELNGFQIIQTVPEPSTSSLFGLTGLGLSLARRRN